MSDCLARRSRRLQLPPTSAHQLSLVDDAIPGVLLMRSEIGNDAACCQGMQPALHVVPEECWSAKAVRRVRVGEAGLGVILEGCDASGRRALPCRGDVLSDLIREARASADLHLVVVDLLAHDLVGLDGGSKLPRPLAARSAQQMRLCAWPCRVRR